LQNQPRKGTSPIKKIFIPRRPGWVITNADLAQLEWRIAAFLSQDPVAIAEIVHDVDYHRDNAIKFFGADPNLPNDHPDFKPLRTTAKVFGFRLLKPLSLQGVTPVENHVNSGELLPGHAGDNPDRRKGERCLALLTRAARTVVPPSPQSDLVPSFVPLTAVVSFIRRLPGSITDSGTLRMAA
jgi:hypothetical protein